jgi:hypothetical protein
MGWPQDEVLELIEQQRVKIVQLQALLERWVNIAQNGQYGARSKHPLCVHPIVEETLQALGPPSVTP